MVKAFGAHVGRWVRKKTNHEPPSISILDTFEHYEHHECHDSQVPPAHGRHFNRHWSSQALPG